MYQGQTGGQSITQTSIQPTRPSAVGLLRQSQYGTPNKNDMQDFNNEMRLSQLDPRLTVISNHDFDIIVETQESNKVLKRSPKDEGLPNF